MNLRNVLITIVGLSLAAVIYAQTSQTSTSQSKSGNGQSSSSSSASAHSSSSKNSSSNASSSKNGSGSGSGNGSGSGSGFSLNAKPTHAIFYTLVDDGGTVDPRQIEVQEKYLGSLQLKGMVLLFGPWRDMPGEMAIVAARTDEEAIEIARNDPAVRAGVFNYEVRAWTVRIPALNQIRN